MRCGLLDMVPMQPSCITLMHPLCIPHASHASHALTQGSHKDKCTYFECELPCDSVQVRGRPHSCIPTWRIPTAAADLCATRPAAARSNICRVAHMTGDAKRAGASLCTCLCTRNIHGKACPFSVARLKMDLPFHDRLAYNRVHRRSVSPLPVVAVR